jgi:hypothetical protein
MSMNEALSGHRQFKSLAKLAQRTEAAGQLHAPERRRAIHWFWLLNPDRPTPEAIGESARFLCDCLYGLFLEGIHFRLLQVFVENSTSERAPMQPFAALPR